MEFLVSRSVPHINRRDANDPANRTFCTMPVKLKFDDRSARINFEKIAKRHLGLRAVMSLPKPIRKEQAAFKNRYRDDIITVRPDARTLELIAFRKKDGERGWTRCAERLALPPGALLPGYTPRQEIALPPDLQGAGGGAESAPVGQC